jgi:hypothetical protein
MELEYVNVTLTKSDLRAIKNFVRKGVKADVKDAFDEGESIDEWIENNNNELEALSSICSLYNETNLHQYAAGQYNHLKEDLKNSLTF